MYENCSDPTPMPDMSWDYAFMPGNGFIMASFGNYSGRVSTGGTVAKCVSADAHTLAADATAMAGALQNLAAKWQSDPNAGALELLIGQYAAGEIGAAAFLAGVVSLDTAAALLAAAAVGLVLWSILEIAHCITDGGVSYRQPVRRSLA